MNIQTRTPFCVVGLAICISLGAFQPLAAHQRTTHKVVIRNSSRESIRVKIIGYDHDAICDIDLAPGASSRVQHLFAGRRILCIWDKSGKVLKRLQVLDVTRGGCLDIRVIDPRAKNVFVIDDCD